MYEERDAGDSAGRRGVLHRFPAAEPDAAQLCELFRLVITGIEGEFHQSGANMVADVSEARGWNVWFLGTNIPQEGVLQAIEEHKADAVGISTTMLLSIPEAVQLVEG